MNSNVLNLIGLAYRANKITIGSDYTLEAIRNKTAKIIFLDKHTSTNIEKELTKKCDLNNIVLVRDFDSDMLSKAIGKNNIKVIGIIDEGLSLLIKKSL